MTKMDFLLELSDRLDCLNEEDRDTSCQFYGEMIDDRMEEGFSEEEAVKAVGEAEKIVEQAVADTPIIKIAKEKFRPKKNDTWILILLLVLALPVWLPVFCSVLVTLVSLYVSLWSAVFSFWVAFVGVCICSAVSIVAGVVFAVKGSFVTTAVMIATGLVLGGLSVLLFLFCKAVTKGLWILTKKFVIWLKNCILGKGKRE